MSDILYREYQPEDAASFVRLHNAVFPPVTEAYWQEFSRQPTTAAVALIDGEVVGTVPFHLRQFQLRPGVVVPVAWEYSVCVREDLRDQGVGSRLMATAHAFFRGRCPVMCVYRGGERSDGYRYYARAGHHDLLYARSWLWRGPGRPLPAGVAAHPWDDLLAREAEVLAVYAAAYGACGGYPVRHGGYYEQAVRTPQYAETPLALSALVVHDAAGALNGYAVLGAEGEHGPLQLLEIAVRPEAAAAWQPLLAGFQALTGQQERVALAQVGSLAPYRGALLALGFEPGSRERSSTMIMAHLVDAEALAQAVWAEAESTAGLEVRVFTPARDVCLHSPRGQARRSVLLEMKEETLARLLMGRLDLAAAYAQEIVTSPDADAATIAAIGAALPFTPWAYHYLDFV
jgi:predicted N-acetyltransferase YhbS